MRSTLSPPIGREILPDDFRTSSVTTVPVKLLERSGVLEHYPQEVFFVAPLARGIDQIEAYRCAPDRADGRRLCLHLESAQHGLKTSACCMIYPMLAGKRLVAPRYFTVHGQCSRRKSGALDTLARLSEFRMREVVYVGMPPISRRSNAAPPPCSRHCSLRSTCAVRSQPRATRSEALRARSVRHASDAR